ncbi:lamin tail domain-containing protein [Fluviicola sp.]|uniref:lamin tail domain-containing protein n=1 Tax=Fluviicola sp. TaxID=1917219 RepID=UPI0031D52EA6
MKKRNTVVRSLFLTSVLALTGFATNGQVLETMGTTALGTGTQTIAAREAAGSFDQTALTYVGTADMRTTTISTGYTGASGGYNTFIAAQKYFEMQGVNAVGCRSTDSLTFGIYKNTNAATGIDYLTLEYSNDNGITWNPLTYNALPTGSGTAKWYLRGVVLPAGAHVANLRIRFTNTLVGTASSNPQYRIDDIRFKCGSTTSCGDAAASISPSGATVLCAGATMPQLTATTGIIDPFYQWYNQDGMITGADQDVYTPATSGTYHVVVSSEDGCEAISEEVYVLVYPQVQYCPIDIVEGCATEIVSACISVKAPELIFSQYVEGSGLNKYLEIYNGTCSAINLTGYQVRAYHNGTPMTGTPSFTIALSGTIAANGTIVIANPSATIWSGTPNIFSANLQFNGDDALVLYNTNTSAVVDIFGSVGNDPGSSWRDNDSTSTTYHWTTEDKTLVRKPCVYSGITVNPGLPGIGGFPTLFTEWDTLAKDDVTGLGSHTFGPSSFNFTPSSGNASVAGVIGNCVDIEVGSVNSVIDVTGSFCTFNNCNAAPGKINVNVINCGARVNSSKSTPTADLFPNPTTGSVMINFNTASEEEVSIVLVDLSGKEQMTIQNGLLSKGTHRMQADLSSLAPGTYLIKISSATENQTFRVVKAEK